PLIEGFNYCFQQILVKNPVSPVRNYEVELGRPMEAARVEPPSSEPTLEFLLIDGQMLPEADNGTEVRRQWEAYEIAWRIREMIEDESRLIYDKHEGIHRPMDYSDVAILFQSMSHITEYEEVFKNTALPYVTIAGRGYYSRQEVWDVLNLL